MEHLHRLEQWRSCCTLCFNCRHDLEMVKAALADARRQAVGRLCPKCRHVILLSDKPTRKPNAGRGGA
jgi:hypothetical protein